MTESMKLSRSVPVRRCPCCGSAVTAREIYKVYPQELLPFEVEAPAWYELRFKAKCPECYLTMDLATTGVCAMPESLSHMESFLREDMQDMENCWDRRTNDA